MYFGHPTGRDPKTVNLLCLGPSVQQYLARNFMRHDMAWPADEIWGLNVGLHHLRADCGFVLDDIIWMEQYSPAHIEMLRNYEYPILVQGIDRFAGFQLEEHGDPFVPFPLTVLAHRFGLRMVEYLHNTVPMVIAYALMIGVKDLRIFGADYTYDGQEREKGRANVEFWAGYAIANGMNVRVGPGSTLMDTGDSFWVYGLHREHPSAVHRRLELALAVRGQGEEAVSGGSVIEAAQ